MATFVVLDTNALPVKGGLRSSFWETLFRLCDTKSITAAISEVTFHEAVNLRVHTAEGFIEELLAAHSRLSGVTYLQPIYAPSAVEIGDEYATSLRERFAILPLSGESAREAFRREARRVLPAREGVGGRDSAIWLTVLELLNEGHEVYLVTNNSSDFGKGGSLHDDLAAEASGASGTLHYIPNPNAFIGEIATSIGAPAFLKDAVSAAFADSIRTHALDIVETAGMSEPSTERLLAAHVDVSDAEIVRAYVIDATAIASVKARVTMSDGPGRPAWGSGAMSGWVAYDPATEVVSPSETDELQIDFR